MKSKMIDITIQGKTPLLCNRFTDEAQMAATSGTRAAITTTSKQPQDVAREKLYTDDNGVLGIPQPNLYRCIIDAGKFFKVGKSKMTTVKSSLVPSCVSIDPVFLPLTHKQPWTVDSRPVRIPATGGRIIAHRPKFDDWALSFEAELDEETMTEDLFRELVDAAGSKIGLGDFRPDTKGPFGKFVVTSWKVQ